MGCVYAYASASQRLLFGVHLNLPFFLSFFKYLVFFFNVYSVLTECMPTCQKTVPDLITDGCSHNVVAGN